MLSFFFRNKKPKISYINNQVQLNEILLLLKQQHYLAIDTEFYRQNTYYPQLCLLQVAFLYKKQTNIVLIDCLTDLCLVDFWQIILDEKIIKIMHSALQDVQIFYNYIKAKPKNIVDTQIMANFCGFDFNIGYATLLQKTLNKNLNKDQQNSDWRIRPLSQKQLDYATGDVLDLFNVYQKLYKILENKQMVSYFDEEMVKFINEIENPDYFHLVNKILHKNNQNYHLQLIHLILLREKWAKIYNVNRQKVLKDDDFVDFINNNMVRNNFNQNMALDFANKNYESNSDQYHYINNEILKKQKILKKIGQEVADEKNICQQFLLSSKHLNKIIHDCINHKSGNLINIIGSWRYNLFGSKIENIIKKWKNIS
jgi:ribonuclease D